jgi:Flp pilus assembly CpaE family ATPase
VEKKLYITEEIEITPNKLHRILSRESEPIEDYHATGKLNIGILSMSRGGGASFLTTSLARFLANTREHFPTVIELGGDSIYDSIGMDKRFAGREFFNFYEALEQGGGIRGKKNMDEGINWILRVSGHKIHLEHEQKLRLIHGAPGDIVLCDLSGCEEEELTLIQHMDQIIFVIDPLPSGILKGYDLFQRLNTMMKDEKIIYVINKFNKGVNRRELQGFLQIKKPIFMPMVNYQSIYTAEYLCKIPYSMDDIRSTIKDQLALIVDRLSF